MFIYVVEQCSFQYDQELSSSENLVVVVQIKVIIVLLNSEFS